MINMAKSFVNNNFFFFFWPCHAACRILVLWPGIEPVPPAVEVQSLTHWTTRKVLKNKLTQNTKTFYTKAKRQPKCPVECATGGIGQGHRSLVLFLMVSLWWLFWYPLIQVVSFVLGCTSFVSLSLWRCVCVCVCTFWELVADFLRRFNKPHTLPLLSAIRKIPTSLALGEQASHKFPDLFHIVREIKTHELLVSVLCSTDRPVTAREAPSYITAYFLGRPGECELLGASLNQIPF